jgi:hypothetical protein
VSGDVAKLAPVVSADGRCPPVHGVSEYQERPLLTWTDTALAGNYAGCAAGRPESPSESAPQRASITHGGKIAG